jgi:hypothetical protein
VFFRIAFVSIPTDILLLLLFDSRFINNIYRITHAVDLKFLSRVHSFNLLPCFVAQSLAYKIISVSYLGMIMIRGTQIFLRI